MIDCPCGIPVEAHGRDSLQLVAALRIIGQVGPLVRVTAREGETYVVPRIYIALHGVKGHELRGLARKYGWERVLA
jgi:hypothetical protein